MPIFFAMAKIIARSKGQSALACSAYRSGKRLFDETEDRVYDYRRKSGIIAEGITAPYYAPRWAKDRQDLWTAVEKREGRKDAQLAREFLIAVPDGLEDRGTLDRLTSFLASTLVSEGMVVDWSLHKPSQEGDQRNFHWHLMTTMRAIEDGEFGKKRREWNEREFLDGLKETICDKFNEELKLRGKSLVDWRSYEEQGIDKDPQEKIGAARTALARKAQRVAKKEVIKPTQVMPDQRQEKETLPEKKVEIVVTKRSGFRR